MTREEAKKMLKAKLECLKRETSGTDIDCNNKNCDECNLCYEQGNMDEQKEALELAIKALEQEPCEDVVSRKEVKEQMLKYGFHAPDMTVTEFVEYLPPVNPQQPCEDCISREDAINKIEEWANGFEEGGYFSGKSVADAIRACGGIIAELPPVRPKYTDEEIDRAQAVEQAYIDKMVELRVDELKRPKGKWIDIEYFDRDYGEEICYRPKCPFCNAEPKEYSNYCPNCGAKLKEEDPDY